MPQQLSPIKICIVGCGAHTEQAYLPTLSRMPEYRVESLIDVNLDRCQHFAARYKVPHYARSIDDIPSTVEAAVVALPHYLHRPISCELLKKKLHVLCEKPMATTAADAEAMVCCAQENAAHLHIGNIFRHYWTSTRVKQLLDSKSLGDLVSFHIEVGYVHNWPTTSGFFFDRQKSGGGVLIDMGAHIIDLLLWWLGDYPTAVTYQDDNFGGVEAECYLELQFRGSIIGTVRLSRLMTLKNIYVLTCKRGTLTFQPYDSSGVCNTITINTGDQTTILKVDRSLCYRDYCEKQLKSFFQTIMSGEISTLQAESVVPSIKLIESCYRNNTHQNIPWLNDAQRNYMVLNKDTRSSDIENKKILVTGTSGFIGGRIAERLYFIFSNKARCLVRNFNKLARLSRLPVNTYIGDVLQYDSLLKVTSGCDIVIHCAYGNTNENAINNRINVDGTENLLRAAVRNGVKKFIYLSSVEVYGENQPPIVNEMTAPNTSKYDYGNSKLEAERLCLKYYEEFGLPVVILRLAVVYGPHSPIWTVAVINRLRNRGFSLCNQFNGTCNPVYIDDCVDAVFLSILNHNANGETFIISGGERLTWNNYFEKYNEMLNLPPLKQTTKLQLQAYRMIRKIFDFGFNRLSPKYGGDMLFTYGYLRERGRIPNLKAILQQGSLLESEDIFTRPAYYVIEKARKKLGFEPRHNLESGLRLVRQWLEGTPRPHES